MRDFRALVREQVAPLALAPSREQKIVEEWSAQLADVYDGLRAEGLSDEGAWRELHNQLPDWSEIGEELLDAEPVAVRMAARSPTPRAQRTLRGIVGSLRERLTAGLLRDLLASVRLLTREPGFSATVILTLAICLGANAAIFAVVNAVLLRPLPVPEPDRIVGMGDVYPTVTPNDILASDVPSYFDRLQALTTLEEQAMFTYWYDTVRIEGIPQELRGMRATPSLFRTLRVAPLLGRTFTDDEAEAGNGRRIILSYPLWQKLYAGDPSVLGQALRLGWTGEPYTIVGVMPREFSFFDRFDDGHTGTSEPGVQFWLPLVFTPEQKSVNGRSRYGFFHIGRLEPDATVRQLQEQLDALRARYAEQFPQFRFDELGMYTLATPLQDALTRGVRRTLYLLWAGAGFVLLIGAINIANLSLARASARRRELATRLALGARRFHVARQLMIEASVPAALGGALGLVVGSGMLRGLAWVGMDSLPNAADIGMDGATIGFVLAVSMVVAALIGVAPATTAGAVTIHHVLVEGTRASAGGRSTRAFRRVLVVTQVALSVVLLIAATLLFTSFRHLLNVDGGFNADGVVTGTLFPPPSRYADPASVVSVTDRILERVRTMPAVEAAGMTSLIALSGHESPAPVSTSREPARDQPTVVPSVVAVTPGYFEAMSTRFLRGRDFADSDRANTQLVAIVDERLAGRLWPGGDPIGKAIYRGEAGPFTVVGVVREVRFEGLTGSSDAIGTAYFPHTQTPPLGRLRWIAVRSAVESAAVVRALRSVLLEVDPDLPLSDVQTMVERTARSLVPQRLATSLGLMFAVVALLLSMLGLYGVLANVVARRTREIGIRMALGSSVAGIFSLVLIEGVLLIGAGLLLGVGGAVAAAQALEGMVFGVQPTDPLLLGSVALATGAVALLACLAPARRAARVDPVQVLSEP